MIDVVAAVIVKDNKFLITRRAPKLKLEGMWEFPGGKVEQGETPEEALKRELVEELKIETEIGISQAQVSRLEKTALKHMRKYV